MRWVGVFPLDRAGMGRVGIDVAAKFASQVGDGSENATGNDLTFDLSEPDLDLVQPGRIGRGEVKLHARMLCEELSNRLRFMSGEVVENDMNLLAAGTRLRLHPGKQGNHDCCAGPRFFRAPGRFWCPARHRAKAYHGGSTRTHDARRVPATAAERGRADPEPGSRSSRRCRRPRRVAADSGTEREYRPLCFRTRDRGWPSNAPGDGVSGRLLSRPDARRLCSRSASPPVCGNSNAWNHREVSCGWPTESGPAMPASAAWPSGRDDRYRAHRVRIEGSAASSG